MAKLTLEWEASFDFDLIGISSHVPNYRLVYSLNQLLSTDFSRSEEDLELVSQKQSNANFAIYNYTNDEDHVDMCIINNRNGYGNLFIPEQKQIDYYMLVWGNYSELSTTELSKLIMKSPHVLTAIQIDPESLKSKNNLLF
jgi:hypothetical protein